MSARIIVKALPKDITKEKLVAHIQLTCPSIEVTDCNLKFTPEGVFRRFAFVGFKSPDDATSAQKNLHGTFIKTSKLQADIAADIGDASTKAWSKYSQRNRANVTKQVATNPKGKSTTPQGEASQAEDKEAAQKPKRTGFIVKMKGLSGYYSEKTVREFFKPIKPVSIRIPRNAQKKPTGAAVVEFLSEKDQDQAMGRNKNFVDGKKIFLKKSTETVQEPKVISPPIWELKAKDPRNQEVESVGDSGRLFVRNLWYGVTEEELEEVFSKYGPLAEITLPVDTLTKKLKGFAHIVYVFPEHALKAYAALDYTSLHGRLMHILPGWEEVTKETSNEKSSYKKKKELRDKAQSSSSHSWNALFLGANAVADTMAQKYNTDKSNILDNDSKTSVGVRMALGETQIVSETREFLKANGIVLDSFSQAAGERSKTVILVKNLPSGVSTEELKEIFSKYGSINRVVMPPSGITAVVEYLEPSEAKKGFIKLNFSKFRSIPLYLEWAPTGVFSKPARRKDEKGGDVDVPETEQTTEEGGSEKAGAVTDKEETEAQEAEDEPEDESCIFVKNLNFDTTDETLRKHFDSTGQIFSATVVKKKNPKIQGELLSMGYGFVQYMKKAEAKETLKVLQNSELDGHKLELKMSTRTVLQVGNRRKQNETKQTSTKILVRNVPFEAKREEIEELFKVFGELKLVRLPKKLRGTGPHRGFAFVDFLTKQDAKRAFNALCHSTHLYGRRLVLEWAEAEDTVEELRRKTAQHFSDDGPKKKVSRASLLRELE